MRLKDTKKHWGFPQAEAEKPGQLLGGSKYTLNFKIIQNDYYSNTLYRFIQH